ncbi:TPA: hypothetical protein L4F62_006468 [Pseudomonas aeruginosa]|uniref:hypothetical protein n=1 Tax=Pseudomonas aeruginosa TaxID=287 RepID=UPI0011611C5F|nr:hypothetical protein [Pseudomonas aeruginosa]EKX3429682.1 hypothetical protein [Pseudomonas aeruginosa]HBO1619907.1 hypothetical protein [Pseudomonas aeruginosa]HBO9386137.1 hypothetical protein [Pseudomonas aeruginosa]HCF2940951.1 hypothetical protein [Pseudomonas aeruginosa]
MALIEILKPETAQALSNRLVIGLAALLVLGCLALILATMSALLKSGHPLLALLIITPLGTGLGHYCVGAIRYCRPGWFKPETAGESK